MSLLSPLLLLCLLLPCTEPVHVSDVLVLLLYPFTVSVVFFLK